MKTLETQRASIQQQLDAINLGLLHVSVKNAESSLQEFELANTNRLGMLDVQRELALHRGAVDHAKSELRTNERDVSRMVRKLAHLSQMLHADTQTAQAAAAVGPARAAVTEAERTLGAARAIQIEVEAMIAEAQRDLDAANTEASATLLAALRNGTKPAPARSSHGMPAALLQALATATADTRAAQIALDQARTELDDADRARLEAQSNLTARDLHLAAAAYARAVATHRAACDVVRLDYDEPDVDEMVGEARRALDQAGVPGEMLGTPQGAEARGSADFVV